MKSKVMKLKPLKQPWVIVFLLILIATVWATLPTPTTIGTNSTASYPTENNTIKLYVYWNDTEGLNSSSGHIFSWNNSGLWVNDSFTLLTEAAAYYGCADWNGCDVAGSIRLGEGATNDSALVLLHWFNVSEPYYLTKMAFLVSFTYLNNSYSSNNISVDFTVRAALCPASSFGNYTCRDTQSLLFTANTSNWSIDGTTNTTITPAQNYSLSSGTVYMLQLNTTSNDGDGTREELYFKDWMAAQGATCPYGNNVRVKENSSTSGTVSCGYFALTLYGVSPWTNITKQVTIDGTATKTRGWQLYLNDTTNSWNATGIQTFSIYNTAPTVTIASPVTNYNTSDTTPSLVFNFTDSDSTSWNSTLYVNGTSYAVNTSSLNATSTTLTVNTTLTSETYQWWVNVTDGLDESNSSKQWFTIDTTLPTLSSISPGTTQVTYTGISQVSLFSASANDTYLDSVLLDFNSTNYTTTLSGSTYERSFLGLPVASYLYKFWANDSAGNWNSSSTYIYEIQTAQVQTGGGSGSGGGGIPLSELEKQLGLKCKENFILYKGECVPVTVPPLTKFELRLTQPIPGLEPLNYLHVMLAVLVVYAMTSLRLGSRNAKKWRERQWRGY